MFLGVWIDRGIELLMRVIEEFWIPKYVRVKTLRRNFSKVADDAFGKSLDEGF